jgi:catechol 2,3-dioxygenase-like lactoylglutathione lyase family enzyme
MNYNGLDHIALATGKIDETIRFWRYLPGTRLIAVIGETGNMQYFFERGPNLGKASVLLSKFRL